MSWWKHFVHGAENMFKGAVGLGGKPSSPTDSGAVNSAAATTEPLGGAATSNAGDAVVNYQTKGKAGLQAQPGKSPVGS